MSANTCTGFPLAQKDLLYEQTSKSPQGDTVVRIGFCADDEACEAAVELLNKLLCGYLSTNDEDIREVTLDKYNMLLCIVASIVYTLGESDQASAYRNPRPIPKYVTLLQLVSYLNATYLTHYSIAGSNVQFAAGILKGVESAIRICIDMYYRFTSGAEAHTTIYTPLLERRFPKNRDVNAIRISQFPDIDDYMKFVEGGYDADILLLPVKYRQMIYDRDDTIAKLTIINLAEHLKQTSEVSEQPPTQEETVEPANESTMPEEQTETPHMSIVVDEQPEAFTNDAFGFGNENQ